MQPTWRAKYATYTLSAPCTEYNVQSNAVLVAPISAWCDGTFMLKLIETKSFKLCFGRATLDLLTRVQVFTGR